MLVLAGLLNAQVRQSGSLEEARNVLIKYHGDGDPNALVANLELQEMQELIELDGSDKRWWDFRALFHSREARQRTFLVTCIAWFGELNLPPTSYYFPLMGANITTLLISPLLTASAVKTVGIMNISTQLLLNAVQTPIIAATAFCGLNTMHNLGRRPLLMFSSAAITVSMAIITACTAEKKGHPAVGAAGIAFLYIFLVFFAFAWAGVPLANKCT